MTSVHSSWAELPLVSSLFPQQSGEVPGVLEGKPTTLFYEPLCVSLAPSPSEEFQQLVTGAVEPSKRYYNIWNMQKSSCAISKQGRPRSSMQSD